MVMYSNDNRGAVIPAVVWGAGGTNDAWSFLLVSGRYIPDPNITNGKDTTAANPNTALMCPSVREQQIYNMCNGGSVVAGNDGYDRRYSTVIIPTGDDPNNGANGACILDVGYAINGVTNANSAAYVPPPPSPAQLATLPSQGVSFSVLSGQTCAPGHKVTDFKLAPQTVLLMDGTEWNTFNGSPTAHLWRIAGSRHGNWIYGANTTYATGICNVLFLDGHCESVNRADLPQINQMTPVAGSPGIDASPIFSTFEPGASNQYVWNTQQQ
jgi:prepilin-type processing-associated H-X9-DG protein